jgi:transposase-like protein
MAKGKDRDRGRESQWRRIVARQKRSGLSIRAFCLENGVAESAFYFWRRELRQREAEQEQRRENAGDAQPAFVPVHVAESPPAGRIEIELSGGRRVHVVGAVDRAVLADVLGVLEGP